MPELALEPVAVPVALLALALVPALGFVAGVWVAVSGGGESSFVAGVAADAVWPGAALGVDAAVFAGAV